MELFNGGVFLSGALTHSHQVAYQSRQLFHRLIRKLPLREGKAKGKNWTPTMNSLEEKTKEKRTQKLRETKVCGIPPAMMNDERKTRIEIEIRTKTKTETVIEIEIEVEHATKTKTDTAKRGVDQEIKTTRRRRT